MDAENLFTNVTVKQIIYIILKNKYNNPSLKISYDSKIDHSQTTEGLHLGSSFSSRYRRLYSPDEWRVYGTAIGLIINFHLKELETKILNEL